MMMINVDWINNPASTAGYKHRMRCIRQGVNPNSTSLTPMSSRSPSESSFMPATSFLNMTNHGSTMRQSHFLPLNGHRGHYPMRTNLLSRPESGRVRLPVPELAGRNKYGQEVKKNKAKSKARTSKAQESKKGKILKGLMRLDHARMFFLFSIRQIRD